MRKYSAVQTGPKIQLGGENGGLLRVLYQVGIAERVKGVLMIPMSSQPITAIKNLKKLLTHSVYEYRSVVTIAFIF